MEAYCFKCRAKHELLNPTPIFFANGSPATQGTCANCGSDKVFKMGRTAEHEGMIPPEPVKREPKPKAEKKVKAKAGKKAAAAKDGETPRATGVPLVIVESPTKAKTIGKFLGRKFVVQASIGHIRDLPKNRLGVAIDADFEPSYVIPVAKKQRVKELKGYAKDAREIWLATDPDREGEAISWHLKHALEKEIEGKPVRRVEFHEITKDAIDHAFAHPREVDIDQVNAQQARRILDRLVGYTLSPLLRDKMSRKGLSAGRVQSVAVRLIVEREREIQAFVPVEYWTIEAELEKLANGPALSKADAKSFIARLFKVRGQDPNLNTEVDSSAVVTALEGAHYSVLNVERKDRTRRPAAPFTTSTMQQEASRKIGFNARRTMGIAQGLYEGKDVGQGPVGLITYMRTDSTNVAESAQKEAREFISAQYGETFMPATAPKYTSRAKNAQEAHEAIRPTSVFRTPDSVKEFLEKEEFRLYDLIWKRFVASQMSNAIFDATTVDIDAQPVDTVAYPAGPVPAFMFRSTGSIVKFPGFLRVYEEGRDEGAAAEDGDDSKDKRLPELTADEPLNLLQLLPEQHFTQPPPRFTEASLVKAMEEYGIGRPSTYATIMTTIQSRDYVRREGKQLAPTELGFMVNDMLVGNFGSYIDVGFTAKVEDELDDIETGSRQWQPVLHDFYDPFKQAVVQATSTIPKMERVIEYTGENCPVCGDGKLVYRSGRFGKFIACSNYPRCTHKESIAIPGVHCPKCGTGKLVERKMKKGNRSFYGCTNYEKKTCDFTTWNRPIPMACPTGDGGLMVEVGKGKAKCLTCENTYDIPEAIAA